MRITFRFTDSEYQQYRQLNRTSITPRWKRYSLALICVLPSFCLALGTHSLIAILSASTVIISVLVIAIVAAIFDKPLVDKHDHVLTIDQSSVLERQSHSRIHTRWDYYDKFQETDSFYLLGRLDRFTAIPKRSVDGSQRDQFVEYCKQVNNEPGAGSGSSSAVPLFSELFGPSNQLQVFDFAYLAGDLGDAMSDQLKLVDLINNPDSINGGRKPRSSKRQSLLGTFWLVVFSVILLYIVFTGTSQVPPSQQWNWWQVFYLILAILLPFILMRGLNRWFRARQKSSAVRVPIFDWRDVEAFYQNKFCFGFHTVNDLVQIIPRRIFSTTEESEKFIERAVGLRREHLRSFAPTEVAVETGNPYQAPSS